MWMRLFCIASLLAATALCAENDDLPFIQPFSFPAQVTRGQSVMTTCAATAGTGPFTFRWAKDGAPLVDQPPVRVQTYDEYSLLFLKAVDSSRTGNYTCFATGAAGATNHTVELVVLEPPEWSVLPTDAEVVLGDGLRIDCQATGVPQPSITWTKKPSSGVPALPQRGRHQTLPNGTLVLKDAFMDDGGEYECQASNGIENPLAKTITVLIHLPPMLQESSQLMRVRSSHSAVLRCDVTGDSPIDVKWFKEHMDPKDNRFKIQDTPLPNGLLSELYITRVMRKDAGVYKCSASNAYGKQDKSIKLVVLEPPNPPSETVVRQVGKHEATVQWAIPYSGNSPITRFVVQYWRDTGAPPKLKEELVSSAESSVTLKELRPGTAYVVRLIAENEFGSSSPSTPVRFYTAEDPPSGYPTDISVVPKGLHELEVHWKPPTPEQQNGVILGYEIGFREHHSLQPYLYREVPLGQGVVLQEYSLRNLKESTEYEIVIRAYNRAGRGPSSVPVLAKTKDKGKLVAPVLWIESTTASSITFRWSGNEDYKGGDLRHILHYRKESGKWEEKLLSPSFVDSYVLSGLEEDSLYFLYVQALSGSVQSSPSLTVSARTSDPSFQRSSMTQVTDGRAGQTTLVISLSVAVSCVVIACVVAFACVYVAKVKTRQGGKRDAHLSDFAEQPSTPRSTPLSRHASNFRYVDVNSRPLLWCSTPAPPNDYPSPYATLPLRPTPMSKRWQSEDGMSPAVSERSEANQRSEPSEDKVSSA